MRLIRLALTALAFVFLSTSCYATIYYVSPVGNDASAGTSPTTPWRSIAKVNSASLGAGDQVLFLRGAMWREMLVPKASGLYFGAYGAGSRPLISGADIVTATWKSVTPTVCSVNVGGDDMTEVWINGVLGKEVSTTAQLIPPGAWYYSGGTLSVVFLSGCPQTGAATPIVEITRRPYAMSVNNIGALIVEHLGFVNGMYNCINVGSNMTGTQTFNDIVWQGARYEGFIANSGSPIITNSEGLYSLSGLTAAGGTGFTLSNSILSGNQGDAIEIYNTYGPSTILNSTISGNATTAPLSRTINNWAASALTASNSILLANPFIPSIYSFTGLTADSTNAYVDPMFASRAAPVIIVPYVDDYINLGVAESVASIAATYGCPISYAVNTKLVTAADWKRIGALQAAGNEIVAHTRSHSDLANNNVLTMNYKGTATTAVMTINQTAGVLQTFLNGSSKADLNIPLLDKYNSIQNLCSSINAAPAYSCVVQPNQLYFTPLNLANINRVNIRSPYIAKAATGYLTWEVEGSKSDIATNIPGYQATTFATPFTSSNLTVENHIRDAGFVANRNGTVDANRNPNGNWMLSNLDVFNMAADWLPSQYEFTRPAGSVAALVEGLGATGGVFAVYSHGVDEFSLAQWQQLFQLLKQDGAMCYTMSQARAYIAAHGVLVLDGTRKNWAETIQLKPVFANTPSSPPQGAHGLQ